MSKYGYGWILVLSAFCGSVWTDAQEPPEQSVIVSPFRPVRYGQKNSRLVVDCRVTSQTHKLEYEWYKDGVKLLSKKRVYIATNGSLIFSKLVSKKHKSDTGHYDCYVTNKFGTVVGAQVDIIVEKQTAVIEPKSLEVEEGGVARFVCSVNHSSGPLLYLWAFKDVEIKTHAHNARMFINGGVLQIYNVTSADEGWYRCTAFINQPMFINGGVLQIYNVTSADEGWYRCTAFRNADNFDILEESAFLKIKSGPITKESRLLNTPQNITVIEQAPALLECLVQGQQPVIISWKYPNGSTVATNERVKVTGASNLVLSQTSRADAGRYMCIVSHRNGSVTTHFFTLNIQVAPEFEKSPQLVQENRIAQRARLNCIATGNPQPDVIWYKDGLRIFPPPEGKLGDELVLHGQYEDSGYYQCVANNSVETIIASAWVNFMRINGTPGEIINVMARPLSHTNVSLTWSPAQTQDQFPVVAYVVHYHELYDFECPGLCTYLYERQREVSKTTYLTVKGLKPYTQYSFNVQGFSLIGAGVLSRPVIVRTREWVPSAAPDVQITPDSPTSFRISWSELPKSARNGVIMQHKVSIEADMKRTVIKLPGTRMEYLETGLDQGKEYKIQVLAGTSLGFPRINDNWITYSTPQVEVRDLPTPELTFSPINSSAVLVSWKNNNNSNVASYRIMVKDLLDSVPMGEYNLSGTASQCIIVGLENRTFYEIDFMVKSSTSNAVKTVKELYQSLSPGDFPEPPPPMAIMPEPLSSTQIRLQWDEPKTSLDIVKYTVRYQQRVAEEMINEENMASYRQTDTASAIIQNLLPYTWYFISVRSHTHSVAGPYSRPVLIQTLEGIPSPPENVLAEVVSPGTVKLKWGPPSKQNGVITYYIIYYNADKDVPDNSWTSIQQNASTTTVVVADLTSKVYYFKLRACTNAGESQSTDIIAINTLNCVGTECPVCQPPQSCVKTEDHERLTVLFEQRLGIVIGCAVGLVCIVICSVFVIIRHRQLRAQYRNNSNVHLMNTSNGQNVGLYLSQQPAVTHSATDSYSPILQRLPENQDSDSKGVEDSYDRRISRPLSHNGPPRIFSRGHQDTAAEQRALLSGGTSSSSQSNETSEERDIGTLDSNSSSPEADFEISYNRIKSSRPPENEVGEEDLPQSEKKHLKDYETVDFDSIGTIENTSHLNRSGVKHSGSDHGSDVHSDVGTDGSENRINSEIPPQQQFYC